MQNSTRTKHKPGQEGGEDERGVNRGEEGTKAEVWTLPD